MMTISTASPSRDMASNLAIHNLKVDLELQGLIKPLRPDEWDRLEVSIRANGCRDSIKTWNETIVDGHNRYQICHQSRIPFTYEEMEFPDKDAVKVWMINEQLGRRNLDKYQRSRLALKEKEILEGEAKERQGTRTDLKQRGQDFPLNSGESHNGGKHAGETAQAVADRAGVSRDTVRKVERIEAEADEETKRKLETGEISIHAAVKQLDREAEQREGAEQLRQANSELVETRKNNTPEPEELEVVGIKRAGEMAYVVEWNQGEPSTVTRKALINEHGYKKCSHCSGYGVVERNGKDRSG